MPGSQNNFYIASPNRSQLIVSLFSSSFLPSPSSTYARLMSFYADRVFLWIQFDFELLILLPLHPTC